jgi:serine/threonine protein kinase
MVKVFDEKDRILYDNNSFSDYLKLTNLHQFNPNEFTERTKINNHCFKAKRNVDGFDQYYILKSFKINKDTAFTPAHNKNLRLMKEFLFAQKTAGNLYSAKLKGYYIGHSKIGLTKYYIVYKYYDNNLEQVLKKNTITFVNKIRIIKMLLEIIKDLHVKGCICLDLKLKNLKLSKRNIIKLASKNSCDITTPYDVDGYFTIKSVLDIYTPPEVFLGHGRNVYWHSDIWSLGVIMSNLFSIKMYKNESKLFDCYSSGMIPKGLYKTIDNIYIQSMILGMLKVIAFERPNIFQVIDCYNKLIDMLATESNELNKQYHIHYTKEEYLSKFVI